MPHRQESSIFLFFGKEEFLISESIQKLKDAYLPRGSEALNCIEAEFPDVAADEIINSASTPPLFSGRKVIILKNVENMDERTEAYFVNYFKKNNHFAFFVFAGEKVKAKSLLYSYIHEKGLVKEFKQLKKMEIFKWVSKKAEESGKSIDAVAVHLLYDLIGGNLKELYNALCKLVSFTGGRKNIESSDVIEIVGNTRVQPVFEMQNHIFSKDVGRAIHVIRNLLLEGEAAVKILGYLASLFRKMAKGKLMVSSGIPKEEIALKLGILPFLREDFFKSIKGYGFREIVDKIAQIQKADIELKSTKLKDLFIMEKLVIKLCS